MCIETDSAARSGSDRSQASSETLDRDPFGEADALVETGPFGLVLLEDLSRPLRHAEAEIFCELCEDKKTRLIAINANIGTFKDSRLQALFGS